MEYMEEVPAPLSYIEMAFYSMISAALQRRVFMGTERWEVFPNTYTILVGKPGTGKGLAINPVKSLLESFKQRRFKLKAADIPNLSSSEQLEAVEALTREFINSNPEVEAKLHGMDALKKKEPLLIPMAPDATTYEGLVNEHANSLRGFVPAVSNWLCKDGMYSHSSLFACAEEVSSMFRKHTDDLVNYLVKSFDCKDYSYRPKTTGLMSEVKNPCLTLLGGTQPNFLKRVFADQLLTEGFASRTIFVFEDSPRFVKFDFSEGMTTAKREAYNRVKEHLSKVCQVFGQVTLSPECHAYMKHLVEEVWSKRRINQSTKLDDYYSRKAIHFRKLTMGMHYGDNTGMEIQLPTAMRTAVLLERIETRMDQALTTGGRNELEGIYEQVINYVRNKGVATRMDIWVAFLSHFKNDKEVDETITLLCGSGKLRYDDKKGGLVIV